jgi:hypothetical protein
MLNVVPSRGGRAGCEGWDWVRVIGRRGREGGAGEREWGECEGVGGGESVMRGEGAHKDEGCGQERRVQRGWEDAVRVMREWGGRRMSGEAGKDKKADLESRTGSKTEE